MERLGGAKVLRVAAVLVSMAMRGESSAVSRAVEASAETTHANMVLEVARIAFCSTEGLILCRLTRTA